MAHNAFNTLKTFQPAAGKTGQYYSLPELAKTFPSVKRLPISIRVVLESGQKLLRITDVHMMTVFLNKTADTYNVRELLRQRFQKD